MIKTTYRWTWKAQDGSDRKVEISTYQSKDSARDKALSYFPEDQHAKEYIQNNEPEIIQDS